MTQRARAVRPWVGSLGRRLACSLSLATAVATATPPEYATFARPQSTTGPSVPAEQLLRIWIVYVGQGDGILIQLPSASGRTDVLIDGGSFVSSDVGRMLEFVETLYAQELADEGAVAVEHGVITHHDADHIRGLTRVLESSTVGIEHLHHNGLASFVAGARGLPATGLPSSPGVFEHEDGAIKRALGLFEPGTSTFAPRYIIDDLAELRTGVDQGEFQGVYDALARAAVEKTSPFPVQSFARCFVGAACLPNVSEARFEQLWPPPELTRYPRSIPQGGSGWGETINGNSLTFRLVYRDFEMLFTGDHNEESEPLLVADLEQAGQLSSLRADVLKVPHHGSRHGDDAFFAAVAPVLSVASMGETGAQSQAMRSAAWQHPSTEIIRLLGGAHRVYLTQLAERRFDWAAVTNTDLLHDLYEPQHILIETDGHVFRIVEVPLDWPDPNTPPTVAQTTRSDGTRWIRAR